VEYDGITFKDWAKTIMQRRPGRLKEQVGFKICALLEGRRRRPMASEYLFGDDVEKDAVAYWLYAKIIKGELSSAKMEEALAAQGVKADDRACIRAMRDALPPTLGSVRQIFIHLEKKSSPVEFERFGPLLLTTRNAFQLALALADRSVVPIDTVRQAALALQAVAPFGNVDFDELIVDARTRKLVSSIPEEVMASFASSSSMDIR